MAGQATIITSLQINSGRIQYQNGGTSFVAVVTGSKGPVPGAVTVPMEGIDIDFSQLIQPGLCRIMNLDLSNPVHYGIWDPLTLRFYALGKLLPGESYILRLSEYIGETVNPLSGTGTVGMGTTLRFVPTVAPLDVLVEAFET